MTNIEAALAGVRRQREVAGKATPGAILIRYPHGGGRMRVDLPSGGCELVADFYNETDREFFDDARNHAERNLALLEALLVARQYRRSPDPEFVTDGDEEIDEAVERALEAFTKEKEIENS